MLQCLFTCNTKLFFKSVQSVYIFTKPQCQTNVKKSILHYNTKPHAQPYTKIMYLTHGFTA